MPPLKFLIASGPTQEPLDPVRFLSNNSTGVMGKCLVQAARRRGHKVTWVRCPDDARTANDLLKKLRGLVKKNDAFIMAAAVCDARPKSVSGFKIKKNSLSQIKLVQNPDILAELSKKKSKKQVFIGFGIESKNLAGNAQKKLSTKGLELIVMQKVSNNTSPFGERSVQTHFFRSDGSRKTYPRGSKKVIARNVIKIAEILLDSQN